MSPMDIKNLTAKPLRIPLSGGKRCFLVPGGKAQISAKQRDEPAVQALLEEGKIQIQTTPPLKRSLGYQG